MFKFLAPNGCTYYNKKQFIYSLPGPGQKWAITRHPNPAEPDGKDCGRGRIHVMKRLNARYAPINWWPWWAKPAGKVVTVVVYDDDGNKIGTKRQANLIGENDEKAAYIAISLRRISVPVFWRALRPPFNWGCGANLCEANLRWADLRGANLSKANLSEANLSGVYHNKYTIWPDGFK
jgi:hypothetical protein